MLKIFVCEDEHYYRTQIVDVIQKYLSMMDYDIRFEFATEQPQKVLDYLSENRTEGLYFLDIDLNTKMNGIELGSSIRELDPRAKIVYITSHAELLYLTFTYKVEAMDFLPKGDLNNLSQKIIDCIEVAHTRYLNTNTPEKKQITVTDGSINQKLNIDDILFFESSHIPHKVTVHLNNRILEYYGNIKDIESLDPNFFRCHQSYVVNLKNIQQVDWKKRLIHMVDDEVCLISTRYKKELAKKNTLIFYIGTTLL
ncbi:DNA-binding response regulator [Tetragenococcus halophilus]|uniref:DNA-binding response regulator n=1 Tax=Tetragenococcus halophilus TaxID=51669 RepID=A0A3G5FGU0_TETHA|nr:LytTR family DNA-binding domain-containing protein [Tetragenococcus halophilus]AYW49574.1 DNA-binding response regulator [Tetragenococcus halophilus]GBD64650.1 hypothetical protein TEHD23766T_2077 [Tetragenococcus halophilus subsp. flandriensis]GMG67062.1 LytTR family DNA-binding domain-containing protein [Tetragenococcus halophilus]